MKSAGNEGVVQSRLQVLHVHVHKSARVCHLHGENLPQHRRLSATSPAPPFHQKALSVGLPAELFAAMVTGEGGFNIQAE